MAADSHVRVDIDVDNDDSRSNISRSNISSAESEEEEFSPHLMSLLKNAANSCPQKVPWRLSFDDANEDAFLALNSSWRRVGIWFVTTASAASLIARGSTPDDNAIGGIWQTLVYGKKQRSAVHIWQTRWQELTPALWCS